MRKEAPMTSIENLCRMTEPFGIIMLRHLLGEDVQSSLDAYKAQGYEIELGVLPAAGSKPQLRFLNVRKYGWSLRVLEQNPKKNSKYAEMARSGRVLCWAIISHEEKCPSPAWICYAVDPKDSSKTVERLKPNPISIGPLDA